MEEYWKQFEVENEQSLEETIRRWRSAAAMVKNPRRRFRFVADLSKRAERKKLQVQGSVSSDDYNPSESLLRGDSPHAYTDYDERGNVATDSDDSNRSESLLTSVSSHANTNYGEQGNVANVVGSDDSNLSESLSPSGSPQANTDLGEPGNQTTTVGFYDSNLSESLLASGSPQANTDLGEPGNQTMTVGPSSSSFMIDIGDENDFNHPRHGTRVTRFQWICMLNALSLEILSACFDQLSSANKPHYALVSLLLAIAAVLTCILELIHNGIKKEVESTNGMGTLKLGPLYFYETRTEPMEDRIATLPFVPGTGKYADCFQII